MTDAHLHLQDPRISDIDSVITSMRETGITRCVVNGTSPADWGKVRSLANSHPDLITPSYGLHPWKTPCEENWKPLLKEYLIGSNHSSTAPPCIGECGLDRWISNYDIKAQEDVFTYQLDLATELNAPITIHILKAWGWFLELLRERQKATSCASLTTERGFLLHSYNGSAELIPELVEAGAYFSFSGYFLNANKTKVIETFRQVPLDRLLVETDAPDMLPPTYVISHPLQSNTTEINHPANLSNIYHHLAEALGLSPEKLHNHVAENFSTFFLKPNP